MCVADSELDPWISRLARPRVSPPLTRGEYVKYCKLAHEYKYSDRGWFEYKCEVMALEEVLKERRHRSPR